MYFPQAIDSLNEQIADVTDEQVSQVAGAAIAHIKTHGWCQNKWHTPEGRVCLRGAIHSGSRALDDRFIVEHVEQTLAVELAVHDVLFPNRKMNHHTPLPKWNDAEDRTEQDVIDILDEVRIKYAPDAMHGGADA